MAQKSGESLRLYTEKFLETAFAACLQNGPELVYNYVSSLVRPVRETAWSLLTTQYGLKQPTDINKVSQLLLTAQGDEDAEGLPDSDHDGQTIKYPKDKKRSYTSSDKNSNGFHRSSPSKHRKLSTCPVHPKGPHSKDDCDVVKEILAGKGSKPSNTGPSAGNTNYNLCRYCKKVPYIQGHNCPERKAHLERKGTSNPHKNRRFLQTVQLTCKIWPT